MTLFWIALIFFIIIAVSMVLIILVQRPQGGGLAGAFGGAGGGAGAETVFGGRVGDALTYATVAAFVVYLGLAITLNLLDVRGDRAADEGASNLPAQTQPIIDPEGLNREQLGGTGE